MSIPRDIEDVHLKILSIIPEENNELKVELEKYIKSMWNKAPEVRKGSETFILYTNILCKHIPEFDTQWKIQVRDIFNNAENV